VRGRANGLDIALGTNGYLLVEEGLEEILSCLTYLRFNISAAEPKRYAQVMGCTEDCFYKVQRIVRECVRIKREKRLSVTLGLQMVLLPEYADQMAPLATLGKEWGVDYLIIKHCSDDERGGLGVDYQKYFNLVNVIKEAEKFSDASYQVKAKWSKLLSDGKRRYPRCYGPPFITQFSGSGLVAPCGMLFNRRYKKFHIGNIVDTSYKKIWKSERYWEVMNYLASDKFDARTQCGTLCLQHKVNEFLWDLKNGDASLARVGDAIPLHVNFI
jgi:MoaA/NifB/PqqE/SkfB family radical SAM enzyme